MTANQVVLAASGGIGYAAAGFRLSAQEIVHPLFVHYGQASADWEWRAVKALAAARKWKEPVRIEMPHIAELSQIGTRFGRDKIGGSAAEIDLMDEGAAPILHEVLVAAVHWAFRKGIPRVVTGLYRSGDPKNINPDQLVPWQHEPRGFVHSANHVLAMTLPVMGMVEIDAPLADLTTTEVVRLAQRLQVPQAMIRSCQSSSEHPCGRCHACKRHRVESDVVTAGPRSPVSVA